jgi:hypothetical protein
MCCHSNVDRCDCDTPRQSKGCCDSPAFWTNREKVTLLEQCLESLKARTRTVEERIAWLKKDA